MEQTRFLRSGELARLAGISTDTLRHYERLKILQAPRRTTGNYRLFPPQAVDRVRLIRGALAVGFSLAELARVLQVRDAGGAPCRQVKCLLAEKLESLNQRISAMLQMRDHLRSLLAGWDARLDATPNGRPARLLEALSTPPALIEPPTLKGRT